MVLNLKLFIGLLLVVCITIGYAWSSQQYQDEHLAKLLACLSSAGVDRNKIHVRDSGPEYDELNWQWNTINGYVTPLVYLVATRVSDIQTAVICCKQSKVRIVPRSGGHSYVKNGFGDSKSLVVDLASMNDIKVNSTQMRCDVGPGARNGQVTFKLWEKGFLVAQGICPTVGFGGLTLGGGYGHFGRLIGLASDNVVEMEMVDAKGQLIVANKDTNKDLFWALRGGGGGNFGIVSKFTFKMYEAPRSIVYGTYRYSSKDFVQFFTAWQRLITSDLPNNIFSLLEMERDWIIMELYAFNADHLLDVTVDHIEKYQDALRFPVPLNSSTLHMSHSEFIVSQGQLYTDNLLTHPSDVAKMVKHHHVGWKKIKSFYAYKTLNKAQISRLNELLVDYLPYAGINIEFYGGALDKIPRSATAFVHRGKNLYIVNPKPLNSQGTEPNNQTDNAMKTFYERSRRLFKHTESYQNYLDQDDPDYLLRLYGSNLMRLIDVKRRIDPENVFHHPESIPVNYWRF